MHDAVEKQDLESCRCGFKFQVSLMSSVTLMSHLTSVGLSFLICKVEQIPPTSHCYKEEKIRQGMVYMFSKSVTTNINFTSNCFEHMPLMTLYLA